MLTVEEIKKCIEEFKPVGFKYECDNSIYAFINVKDLASFTIDEFTNIQCIGGAVYYPLFLQRVIEGINRKLNGDGWISVDYDSVTCNLDEGETVREFEHDGKNIDQAKEQAIKYILEKI